MLVAGIASSVLSGLNGAQNGQSKFQQIRGEFKQLAQDLQSGNLAQAQQDYTTLSQNIPGLSQTSSAASSALSSAATAASGSQTNSNPLLQAFNQLGKDLQSGNLQAAQQDFANIEKTAQQNVQNAQQNTQQTGGHHHHHHHVESSQRSSSSSSSQQANPISQAFSTLGQDLQSGNLQGAQQAFATLQNDLQQIGGFTTPASSGAASASISASTGNLNVSA